MARERGEVIVMTGDSIILTGRPATVLCAVMRGLKKEAYGEGFLDKLDDWECALADICIEVIKGTGLYLDARNKKKTAAWRGKKFKG